MNDFTMEERSWVTGMVYRLIAEYYAHWEDAAFARDQLDEVYRETLHEGLAAANRSEFVAVLMRWIGQLHNAHSWCVDQTWGDRNQLGFQLDRLDGEWVVTASAVTAVDIGDVVESIDGVLPDQWMAQAGPYMSAKRTGAREAQWQYFMPFFWNASESVLNVRGRDDRVRSVRYRPIPLHAGRPGRPNHTEGRWLREGRIGYIRIPSFGDPHYEAQALAYVKQFASAPTLIFDIRTNDGGSTPDDLTAAIMDRPYRWWTETAPNIGHLRRRHAQNPHFTILPDGSGACCEGEWQAPSTHAYQGQIIALTGRYAGSAAEDFLMPFKDTGRALLVGESTWGSTGQPVFVRYGTLRVGIGSVRAYMPDRTPFEGIGIAPDVEIAATRDDLYAGRDAVLEAVLEMVL